MSGLATPKPERILAPDLRPPTERIDWVLAVVSAELRQAIQRYPKPFNSPHEGYAMIREELERELWEHVCGNSGRTPAAIEEAIQVAAMALRYVHDLADWGPRQRVEGTGS